MVKKKEKPFNSGKWTRARYFGFIRSALRKASMKWPPRNEAKKIAARPTKSKDKRRKFDYQCNACKGWFKGNETQVDHIIECGSLKSFEDLVGFVERLFCEVDGFQVLCKGCHKDKKKGK